MAARVGTYPILLSDIDRNVRETFRRRKPAPEAWPLLRAQALELLIGQRIVQNYLDREKLGATEYEIDAALKEIRANALRRHKSFEAFLKERRIDETTLRSQVAWRLSWKKYIDAQVNDAAREQYFNRHRKELDGTEVRARHILLKPPMGSTDAAVEALVKQAEVLRAKIVANEIAFEAAAEANSAGPSRKTGGDLGFFPRHGVMSEEFASAAFKLEPGEISPPVVSPFGIHLIECLEIRPGAKTWSDVRKQLDPLLAKELFDQLAKQERANVKVEYTGEAPYLDPADGKLIPSRP